MVCMTILCILLSVNDIVVNILPGIPTQRDTELLRRLEQTMYGDHQFRARLDSYARTLEEIIVNLQAKKNDVGDINGGNGGHSGDNV